MLQKGATENITPGQDIPHLTFSYWLGDIMLQAF